MTSSSLGDDRSSASKTRADVAPDGREPERVGSEGFIDAMMLVAERRAEAEAEADDEQPQEVAASPRVEAVGPPPVAARVASDDFIDAVLELAETRAAAAVQEAELQRAQQLVEQQRVAEKRAERERAVLRRAEQPASRSRRASSGSSDEILRRPPTRQDGPRADNGRAAADEVRVGGGLKIAERDELAETTAMSARAEAPAAEPHVHPTRPTPWWRKRPSLEIIFAAIATVLMVIGLALVVAELF